MRGHAIGRADDYDRAFEERQRAGQDVHGEATLVASFSPRSVLDAGCGTGRVAIELARRGISVVGVDVDREMLAVARGKAPQLGWVEGDLTTVEILEANGSLRRFGAVVMAGNVMIFLSPGTEGAAVANLSRHLEPGGLLIAGFQLRPGGLAAADYEAHAVACGGRPVHRWSGWGGEPYPGRGDYVVMVHEAS